MRRGQTRDMKEPVPARRPPPTTPEARENQVISAAYDLAESQIRDGSASSQVITHFLKLGSSRETLEQERLYNENVLLRAKKDAMDSQARIEEMYGAALNAMRAYAGQPVEETSELEVGYEDEDFL